LDNYAVVKNELNQKTTTQSSEPVIDATPVETDSKDTQPKDDQNAKYPKSIGKFMVKRGQSGQSGEQQAMLSLEEMKKFED
jgi:hypothetical protein